MPWRNFFEALGDFFEWTFQILPIVGNNMNYLLMIIMAGFGAYWLGQMVKQSRTGEQ